jgi:hypothetical protein
MTNPFIGEQTGLVNISNGVEVDASTADGILNFRSQKGKSPGNEVVSDHYLVAFSEGHAFFEAGRSVCRIFSQGRQ